MTDGDSEDPTDALRDAAITLASRIRIALPYRRAANSDLAAIETQLALLRGAGLPEDDAAIVELSGLRETLEILTLP